MTPRLIDRRSRTKQAAAAVAALAVTATALAVTSSGIAAAADENVALGATASVSSSYSGYSADAINDGVVSGYPADASAEWASNAETVGAWARLTWDEPQTVAEVHLYDRPNSSDHVTAGTLRFSDGSEVSVGTLPDDAVAPATVSFEAKSVTWVEFVVDETSAATFAAGLAEFEVYPEAGAEPTPTPTPTRTPTPTTPPGDPGIASAELGDPPAWDGMVGNPGDGSHDPATAATTRGGRECWTTSNAGLVNDFLYFQIAPERKSGAAGGYAFVQVEYFDAGPGTFTIQYDGPTGTQVGDAVGLTGGDVWRTHTFQLADIEFGNDLPTAADFRIASWDGRFGRSPTPVCVASVSVSFGPAPAVVLTPRNLVLIEGEGDIPVATTAEIIDWTAYDEQGIPAETGSIAVEPGGSAAVGELPNDGTAAAEIALEQDRTVEWVQFTVTGVRSGTFAAGLSEFEVLAPDGTNIALDATATASSSFTGYTPAAVVDGVRSGYPADAGAEWASNAETLGTWVRLQWDEPQTIGAINLVDRPNAADQVVAGVLTFSDGTSVPVGELGPGYYTLEVESAVNDVLVARSVPLAVLSDLPHDAVRDASPFGIGAHFGQTDPVSMVDLMAKVGFSHVRDSIRWEVTETSPGVYELPGHAPAMLDAFERTGIDPMFLVGLRNQFYDEGLTPSSPEGHEAFGDYASAMLGLTGADRVEVYNEFDTQTFNNGLCGRTADCYLPLLQATYDQVKADHPDTEVVAPSGGDFGFWERLFELGGLDYLDTLSPHIYGFPAAPEDSPLTVIPELDELIRQYNGGETVPIAISESGYPTHTSGGVTESEQADYLVRGEMIALAGGADRFYWYDFLNDGTNPAEQEHNFGLVRRPSGGVTYSPKPALIAQAVLIREVAGRELTGGNELPEPAHSYVWTGDDKLPVRVMWATEPATAVLSTVGPVKMTDTYGREQIIWPRAGRVQLDLSGHPVYVTGLVRSVELTTTPALQLSVPERVAAGSPVPVTLIVDRRDGTTPAGRWTTFRIGDETYRMTTRPGEVSTLDITVPASATKGERTITASAGLGPFATARLSADTDVVQPVEVTVDPVVTAVAPLQAQLAVTITNNRPDGALDVSSLDWELGGDSGTVMSVDPVPVGASTQVLVDLAGVAPWEEYDYSVEVNVTDGSASITSGVTGFGPIEPSGGDDVPAIDFVDLGLADFPRQTCDGPDDQSGTVSLEYTDDALVVSAAVTDDVHVNDQAASAGWNGDAIQVAVTPDLPGRTPDRTEHTVALLPDGPAIYIHDAAPGQSIGPSPGASALIERDGTLTSYVITIPWAELGFAGPPDVFGLSFVVADDDTGAGRGGWHEWGGGIARSKNPALLRPVQLLAGDS